MGKLLKHIGAIARHTASGATVPGAPTIGTAVAGDAQASVPFTAPASNGGSTILSYTATSSPGNFTGTIYQAGSGTIVVTGLSNGTAYTFTVKATNAIGEGAASAASNSVTPAVASSNEFIIIKESSSVLCYSNDYFESDSHRVTGLTDLVACGFTGTLCGWYILGTTTNAVFYWTTDGGDSWSNVTAPYNCGQASMSDDGDYIILGGDENATGSPRHKCYNPTDGWYTVDASQYSGSYGGNTCAITRDGQHALIYTRNIGLRYNSNYLDPNSWAAGAAIGGSSYRTPFFCPDSSGWCCGSSENDYLYWRNDMTLSNYSYSSSIVNNLTYSGAFKSSRFRVCSTTNDTYESNNATTKTKIHDTKEMITASDDDFTIVFEQNRDGGDGTVNGHSLTNVANDAIYVSRDGEHIIYCNESDGKLYYSNNGGTSFSDRTPSGASLTAALIWQQWNRMWW